MEIRHHSGRNAGLTDGLHSVLEHLAVFCSVDGLGPRTQKLHPMLGQKTFLGQLHGKGQTSLPPQCGKETVGLFLLDDALDGFCIEGLDVDGIGHVAVRHQGGGIGVHQHHLQSLLLQCLAGLSSRIVKLGGLTNDNRPGTDDHNLANILIQWHIISLPLIPAEPLLSCSWPPRYLQSGRTQSPCPAGRQ